MKKMLLAGLLLFVLQVAGAQKVYFIYIQSEAGTPFFVKMGDKVASATASGYLILPKLVDSVYTFSVGKAGEAANESRFSVTIDKKDRGFLLKETDGKIGLFDLQALTLLQPIAAAASSGKAMAKRSDAFTVLLAQAANDPSLLDVRGETTAAVLPERQNTEPTPAVIVSTKEPERREPVVENNEPQPKDTITTNAIARETLKEQAAESGAVSQSEAAAPMPETAKDNTTTTGSSPEVAQQTPVPAEPVFKRSVITRKSESSTTEGFGLVFLDASENATDTIRILIPNPTSVLRKEEDKDGDSKKFLNITNVDTAKADTSVAIANEKLRAAEKRSRCITAASEMDFRKLRKNMAAEKNDNAMIAAAEKAFKKNWFSTDQLCKLSSLFLTPSGKYKFFDAAYGHISNQEQYALVQSELNDARYINRFQMLIAKQ